MYLEKMLRVVFISFWNLIIRIFRSCGTGMHIPFKIRLSELECTFCYSTASFCNVFTLVRAVRFSLEAESVLSVAPSAVIYCLC